MDWSIFIITKRKCLVIFYLATILHPVNVQYLPGMPLPMPAPAIGAVPMPPPAMGLPPPPMITFQPSPHISVMQLGVPPPIKISDIIEANKKLDIKPAPGYPLPMPLPLGVAGLPPPMCGPVPPGVPLPPHCPPGPPMGPYPIPHPAPFLMQAPPYPPHPHYMRRPIWRTISSESSCSESDSCSDESRSSETSSGDTRRSGSRRRNGSKKFEKLSRRKFSRRILNTESDNDVKPVFSYINNKGEMKIKKSITDMEAAQLIRENDNKISSEQVQNVKVFTDVDENKNSRLVMVSNPEDAIELDSKPHEQISLRRSKGKKLREGKKELVFKTPHNKQISNLTVSFQVI